MQVKRYLGQIDSQNLLGEGILWHPKEHALYWTDIQNKRLHVCRKINTTLKSQRAYKNLPFETIELPYRLGCFAFTDQANVIVAGFDQGIALYDLKKQTLKWLSQPEIDNEHTRFNDGRSDPKGRFWAGSMIENSEYKKLKTNQQAALYCVYFDKSSEQETDTGADFGQAYSQQVLSGLHISNGVCFNSDASIMYHADSPTHKIYQYSLDAAGQIVDRSLFAKFEKSHYPDGAIVDVKGNLWTALWGGACIACIAPNGEEVFRYPMPMLQPSCVCIGGENMNLLFVTSAQETLSETQLAAQPRAGNVLIYELSESLGREEPLLKI